MEVGNIKLYRQITEWEWYCDINTCRLFIHMLLKANWKQGRFQGVEIPRGSFASSYNILSKETGLTVQQVRTALKHLNSTQEVTQCQHGKFTVFTVKNYSLYQDTNTVTNNDVTQVQHDDNREVTTIEEVKKEKKKEVKNNIICSEQSTEQPVIIFSLNDNTQYPVYRGAVQEWAELYPAVDVIQQLRSMKGWLDSNPRKRKTKSGITRFINNWLAKEQNKGGAVTTPQPVSNSNKLQTEEYLEKRMREMGL